MRENYYAIYNKKKTVYWNAYHGEWEYSHTDFPSPLNLIPESEVLDTLFVCQTDLLELDIEEYSLYFTIGMRGDMYYSEAMQKI